MYNILIKWYFMGNSRLILAINGILMITLGLTFWVFPEFFTLAMFPNIEKNNDALNVAIALRKNMGAGCVFNHQAFD